MKLTVLDFSIILAYLLTIVVIGFVLKRAAQKDKGSYLLGSNKLPWYMLSLSNASGMFDISGTMWLVTAMFVYGLKSVWLPWLWPVFNQIFLMAYLSKWLRRSNATTGAEWILTRFGKGTGSRLSHSIVIVFAILSCLGFMAYGFVGVGKFMEIFIPWEVVSSWLHVELDSQYVPHLYGIVFTSFAVLYTLLGGMVSIVWADLIQYTIMTLAAVAVGIIAFMAVGRHGLPVPDGWMTPSFSSLLEIDWSGYIAEVSQKVSDDGYTLFGALFMMMLFKGILVSAAGPAPNYDMQKILAAKTPAEAAKMSGFVSVVLMPSRYLMIAGFAILGIIYYDQLDLMVAGRIDFEQILPSAINEFVPAGLLGLLLAGLLAAFISTFAGTLNAAQAYITNDLYLRYFNPSASNKQIKWSNYIAGLVMVFIGVLLGVFAKNVNQVLQLIVSALWGGYVASNLIKWYWWKFNGHGYFWGMISGMAISFLPMVFTGILPSMFPTIAPDIRILYFFPVILVVSLIGCVLGTWFGKPVEEEILVKFYLNVRPWGFWKPIQQKVLAANPGFKVNKNFRLDMLVIVIGTICQTALVILPIYLVARQTVFFLITLGVTLVTMAILKFIWWDKLND